MTEWIREDSLGVLGSCERARPSAAEPLRGGSTAEEEVPPGDAGENVLATDWEAEFRASGVKKGCGKASSCAQAPSSEQVWQDVAALPGPCWRAGLGGGRRRLTRRPAQEAIPAFVVVEGGLEHSVTDAHAKRADRRKGGGAGTAVRTTTVHVRLHVKPGARRSQFLPPGGGAALGSAEELDLQARPPGLPPPYLPPLPACGADAGRGARGWWQVAAPPREGEANAAVVETIGEATKAVRFCPAPPSSEPAPPPSYASPYCTPYCSLHTVRSA
jgi:hypothetical protein